MAAACSSDGLGFSHELCSETMAPSLLCDPEHLHEKPAIGCCANEPANHGSLRVAGEKRERPSITRGDIPTKRLKEPVLDRVGDRSGRIILDGYRDWVHRCHAPTYRTIHHRLQKIASSE